MHPVRTAANGRSDLPNFIILFAEEDLNAFLSQDIAERGISIMVGGKDPERSTDGPAQHRQTLSG